MRFKQLIEMPLDLSPLNHEVAKDNKRHVLVHMHPQHFLDLTTGPSVEPSAASIMQKAQPLARYNEYTASGETLNSPFLSIEGDGRVSGHEGRHRAAALLKAKETVMPVHLRLRDTPAGVKTNRDIGWEHIPDTIHGQYSDRSVSKDSMTLLKDKVAAPFHESENYNSLTHEVLASHGYKHHQGKGGPKSWSRQRNEVVGRLDRSALHSDLIGIGWKPYDHESDTVDGNRFHMHVFRQGSQRLYLHHEINDVGANAPYVITSHASTEA